MMQSAATKSSVALPQINSDSDLRSFLKTLPPVDQVGAQARAAMLATRSIKTSSKLWAIDRKSTRLNSSHIPLSRMPSSA